MPELPEVETVRLTVSAALRGCRVERVEAQPVTLRLPLDAQAWGGVVGRRLVAVDRRGKYLLARLEDRAAVVHLGMTGRLMVVGAHEPRLGHTHLVLGFEDGRELRFVDPRRFGFAVVTRADEVDCFPPLVRLGPDPLTGDAEEALVQAARRSRSPVRTVLLDQQVLAGVGNIYACESLHRAGIHPSRPLSRISRRRLRALAEAVREVLHAALAAGGTTLADGGFVAGDGRAGYFAVQLGVYGREGQACSRCGGQVRRRVLAGRSAYYCPGCQR